MSASVCSLDLAQGFIVPASLKNAAALRCRYSGSSHDRSRMDFFDADPAGTATVDALEEHG